MKWRVAPLWGVVALLLLPHCFSHREAITPFKLGWPRVHAGDEPHYVVFINSLVWDGDLKLANNYQSALEGSLQAGIRYRGRVLDHHSAWYEEGERHHWREYYEIAPRHNRPVLKKGVDPPGRHVERPHNVPGLAILLAPFVSPLKGTGLMESAAVVWSGGAMVVAAFFFWGIARHLSSDPFVCGMSLALAFLGTPLWHYGRSLFPEAYLPCFLLGAIYFQPQMGIGLGNRCPRDCWGDFGHHKPFRCRSILGVLDNPSLRGVMMGE